MSALLLFLLAQAAPSERLHVEWVAPHGCPDQSELASTLASSVPKDRTFSAAVRIDEPREADRPWRAVVTTLHDGQERTRVVEAPDCARVTEAAVLVLTLAATALPDEPKRESSPAALTAAEPLPTRELSADEPLPTRELTDDEHVKRQPFVLNLRLQPLVGASAGVFPVPGVSVGLSVGFERGPVRLDLAAHTWFESQTPETLRGARFLLVSFALRGCWLFTPRDRLHLGPCLAVEGGPMRAEATRVTTPSPAEVVWLATTAGATAGYDASSLIHPWVSLQLGANLVRPSFLIDTPSEQVVAFAMGLPMGRLTIGLEFILQ